MGHWVARPLLLSQLRDVCFPPAKKKTFEVQAELVLVQTRVSDILHHQFL